MSCALILLSFFTLLFFIIMYLCGNLRKKRLEHIYDFPKSRAGRV